jgi:hypothetical protein
MYFACIDCKYINIRLNWLCFEETDIRLKMLKFVFNNSIAVLNKRFIISWILSSLLMFGISYSWHGLYLNDVRTLNYPLTIYLVSSAIAYLFIGYLLMRAYTSTFFNQFFGNLFVRGLICGAVFGLVLYMTALVLGVTFTKNISLTNIIIDVSWQTFEQAMGGFLIATLHALVFEPVPMHRIRENREG